MLDENLPTFLLKSSTEKPKENSTFYYTQHGSDAEPTYSLRHPDPELQGSRNRYAAALYDSHNPDVLFAEVLLIPDWTQPSLSVDAIRSNGGVAPPPVPIMPTEFVVQLYNPDQQIKVKQKPGSWGSTASWELELPQQSFRQPSTSSIDRTQHDPAASELTPKIGLRWRRDGKFAKDLTCYLSGQRINADGSKRRNKEPDITVAIFKGLKEVTLYEPNLQRIELEDLKGFEVVLLLSAVVIRDVYFGQIEQAFNVSSLSRTGSASAAPSRPTAMAGVDGAQISNSAHHRNDMVSATVPQAGRSQRGDRIPPTDPRSQWEIDAEAARLARQAEAEERERKRKEAVEQHRTRKMLEAEEKAQRRKAAEVDKETERLRRLYGNQGESVWRHSARPAAYTHQSSPVSQQSHQPVLRPQSFQGPLMAPRPVNWGPAGFAPAPRPGPARGPYLHVPNGYPSQVQFSSNTGLGPPPQLKAKRSFWGFRRDVDNPKLQKKKSSMF